MQSNRMDVGDYIKPHKKRVSEFLAKCEETKMKRVDIEWLVIKKRAEKDKISEQIKKMQEKLSRDHQKLYAKEAVLESVACELQSLEGDLLQST